MSTEVRWIKIATDIFDDEKILLIESMPDADALIVIWLKLLVLAGKSNSSGVLLMDGVIPYTDEMLASIFRRPLNTVKLAIATFEKFGMIEVMNDVITLPKWEKHQSLDKLEKMQKQNRDRVKRYRERQKQLTAGASNVTCNDDVMPCNALEQDIDKDIDIESSSLGRKGENLLHRLTEEESEIIFSRYKDADYLIDEVQADVDRKNKKVKKPFEYIVGYATNHNWETI